MTECHCHGSNTVSKYLCDMFSPCHGSWLMHLHKAGPKISNICHCTNGRIETPKTPRSSAEGARIEAPTAPCSSAEGARIEAPKVPRGVGCGEGVSPSPPRVGSGEGTVPLPRKFLDFWHLNGEFLRILGSIICLLYTQKWCIRTSKTDTYCCLRIRRERDGEICQATQKKVSKVQIILHWSYLISKIWSAVVCSFCMLL